MAYEITDVQVEGLEGWASLINPLVERAKEEGVQILQIKEKFGGLRIYLENPSRELFDATLEAERRSFSICDRCGKDAKRRTINGYLRTLCDEHYQQKLKEYK